MRKLESVLAVALFLTIALIAMISSIAAALAVVITAIVLAVVVGLERKLVALACAIAVLIFQQASPPSGFKGVREDKPGAGGPAGKKLNSIRHKYRERRRG
jgi:hypothetical protein